MVTMNEFLKSYLLEIIIKTSTSSAFLSVFLGVFLSFFVFPAWPIGRRAKKVDLLRQCAEEIAVRVALFKLKLAASEPNTPQEALLKEAAYEQAKELEEHLKKELEWLAPPPDKLWLQRATWKEVFLPAPYEGQQNLSFAARCAWWIFIIVFLVLRVFSAACMLLLLSAVFRLELFPHPTAVVFEFIVLMVIYASVSWYASLSLRRSVYVSAMRHQKPNLQIQNLI
jgi:hypothetical protein